MTDAEREGRIAACKIRVLRAARDFAKQFADLNGNLQDCTDDIDELIDAADRLIELEAMRG